MNLGSRRLISPRAGREWGCQTANSTCYGPPVQHPVVHLNERAMAALGVLLDLLGRGQQSGAFRRRPLPAQAAACSSQVHGITMLSIEGLLMPEKVGAAPVQAALDTLLDGLEA